MIVKKDDKIEIWSDGKIYGFKRKIGEFFVIMPICLIIFLFVTWFWLGETIKEEDIPFLIIYIVISLLIGFVLFRKKEQKLVITLDSNYLEILKNNKIVKFEISQIYTMIILSEAFRVGSASIHILYKQNDRKKKRVFYLSPTAGKELKSAIIEHNEEFVIRKDSLPGMTIFVKEN